MRYALQGGLWFHQHVWRGERMAHLVSSDRQRLLEAGARLGMNEAWLQYKPLRHVDTRHRVDAWHWDLRGRYFDAGLRLASPPLSAPPVQSG